MAMSAHMVCTMVTHHAGRYGTMATHHAGRYGTMASWPLILFKLTLISPSSRSVEGV